jgi:hypothetical protein
MLSLVSTLVNFLILLCLIYQINILRNITASLNNIFLKMDRIRKDPEQDIHGDLNKRLLGIQQNRFAKTFRIYDRED